MGAITEYLQQVIATQINRAGIAVWYDPERYFVDVLDRLALPDETTILRYEGSFFKLRFEIEPYIEIKSDYYGSVKPPKLLIYVPLKRDDTHQALVEVETCGVVLLPGSQPPERNTSLSYIARNALNAHMSGERIDQIERETEQGRYTLADLDEIAERGAGVSTAHVTLIFETAAPNTIALKLLSDDKYDKQLEKRDAVGEAADLLGQHFGTQLPDSAPEALRNALARHLLLMDFLDSIGDPIPQELAGIPFPSSRFLIRNCLDTTQLWRDAHRDSYVEMVKHVQQSLEIERLEITLRQLEQTETFLAGEEMLQDEVEAELVETSNSKLVETAIQRQSAFWATAEPRVQARWTLIATIGQLLVHADGIDRALRRDMDHLSAAELVQRYTEGETPWCLLDTYYRRMERLLVDYLTVLDMSDTLERLRAQANKVYMQIAGELSELFVERLQGVGFKLPELPHQSRVFEAAVRPVLAHGKSAYVLVDALRYEMAKDLVENVIAETFDAELIPVFAAVPTITEIGMAALMPEADSGRIVKVGDSKLGLAIGDRILKNRAERITWLQEHVQGVFESVELQELLTRRKKIRQKLENADFLLVTSREIDELGEGNSIGMARQVMDSVLLQLHGAFRYLRDKGFDNIVVAADHGHIFLSDDLEDDRKLDAPGGETVDLHRRVWVGYGGATSSSFLRTELRKFGLESDFDIAVPYNFACFKARGGGDNYFHGGLSLQEVVVPQIVIKSRVTAQELHSKLQWKIEPGSQTIGAITSVTIKGHAAQLFDIKPPRIRVEIRMGKTSISQALAAGYNFDPSTGSVQLRLREDRPNEIEQVTFTLKVEGGEQKTAYIVLFDADTGIELSRSKNYEVTIFV